MLNSRIFLQDLEMQKRTVKDMEFDYNIAKEQLAIKEKLIQVGSWDVNIFFWKGGEGYFTDLTYLTQEKYKSIG